MPEATGVHLTYRRKPQQPRWILIRECHGPVSVRPRTADIRREMPRFVENVSWPVLVTCPLRFSFPSPCHSQSPCHPACCLIARSSSALANRYRGYPDRLTQPRPVKRKEAVGSSSSIKKKSSKWLMGFREKKKKMKNNQRLKSNKNNGRSIKLPSLMYHHFFFYLWVNVQYEKCIKCEERIFREIRKIEKVIKFERLDRFSQNYMGIAGRSYPVCVRLITRKDKKL